MLWLGWGHGGVQVGGPTPEAGRDGWGGLLPGKTCGITSGMTCGMTCGMTGDT